MDKSELKFGSLDEVLNRLNLLSEGYEKLGNWTLGQNCQHVATMMRLEQAIGKTPIGWFAELFRIPRILRATGRNADRFGIRLPAIPFARPKQSKASDEMGVASLRAAIARQKIRKRAESSTRFHLWHCSHHLAFLTPSPVTTGARELMASPD